MSIDGEEDTYLRELYHGLSDDDVRVKDGVVKEETNLIKDLGEDVKDGNGGALQAPAISQIQQQQQSQEATVCWERFLHMRSLKVLLVENDDCTRQIVTALLRNCGYEVTEAANGLQAWKILEDLTHHVDLILTEVVLPYLSGIALLCKIMHHKTRRNVPVIMMSSHDSMGLVFKCLSKGAVDFLVKPMRKNELKNLWQHVWRRCQSSSGSGSESGTQNQKSVNSKGVENSDTKNSHYDEDDNGSMGLNVGKGSDDGSGTQSSWTKQAVEIDSPQLMLSGDQVAECPDSTCAQVIHSNAEISSNKQVAVTIATEFREHKDQLGVPRTLDLQLGFRVADLVGKDQNNLLEKGHSILNEKTEVQVDPSSDNPLPKLRYEAVDLQGGTTNSTDHCMDTTGMEAISRHSKILDAKDKAISEAKEMTSVEFSLNRLRGVRDNVFRRSDSSAFLRYNKASKTKKVPARDVRSGSPHDNDVDLTGKASARDLQCYSNFSHPSHCSTVGSNNIDMGSTKNYSSSQPAFLNNKSAAPCLSKCLHPPVTFLAKGDIFSASQQVLSVEAGGVACRAMVAQPSGTHLEPQDQHLSHQHDHCHFLLNMQHEHQSHQLPPQLDDLSSKKVAAAAPLCGSSNAFGGAIENNTGNYSINGSASGSNHGCNGQNGSRTAVNARVTNVTSDNRVPGNSGSGDASGNGGGNRIDHDKIAQRAAALTKFRQKRNERCFRRRVRYHGRKKLVEQRPRVRGQFIRHASSENTGRATDE